MMPTWKWAWEKKVMVAPLHPESYLNFQTRYNGGKEAVSRNIHGGALAGGKESSFNWDSNYKAKNVTGWQSTG